MENSLDLQDQLNSLILELSKTEKHQKLEYQKIEKLVKKSELRVAKCREQLKSNESRIHAWILQKSKSIPSVLKPTLINEYPTFFSDSKYGRVTLARNFVGRPLSIIETWVDLPTHPALHNLFIRRREIENALKTISSETKEVKKEESQVKKQFEIKKKNLQSKTLTVKKNIAASNSKKYSGGPKRTSTAPKMDIENWEDAENFAVKYMRWLGYTDARKTRAGSDEGKDVDSSKAVAQVKDMGTGVSRPMLQQLFGVAAAEKKIPIFFARSYAKTAKEWGQKHGMALFQFSIRGDVKAVSTKAEQILKKNSN